MFSFFNRPRLRGAAGAPGPTGPAGQDGRDGRDGADATTHVNLHYPSPTFHLVEHAPADHPVPTRSHQADAGHDLYSAQGGSIPSGQRRAIPTGYSADLAPVTYGKIEGRSGLARDYGLHILGGVIDSGYTGEIVVILQNSGDRPFRYTVGDRIAQLVVQPVVTDTGEHQPGGERGADGFGSTGSGDNLDHLKDALYGRAAQREYAAGGTPPEPSMPDTYLGTVVEDNHGLQWEYMAGNGGTSWWVTGRTHSDRVLRLTGPVSHLWIHRYLPDENAPFHVVDTDTDTDTAVDSTSSAAYFNEHHSTPGVVVQDREGDYWEYLDTVPGGSIGAAPGHGWTPGDTPEARRDRQLLGHGHTELPEMYAPYTDVSPPEETDLEEPDLDVDMVNQPPHYTDHPVFPGECWTYAKWMVYGQGVAFKYLWRAESKDTVVANLDKAHRYLSKGIADEGLEWINLEDGHDDLATLLTGSITGVNTWEWTHGGYTLGQLYTATAAVYTSLGESEYAMDYVNLALNWYQTPGNV